MHDVTAGSLSEVDGCPCFQATVDAAAVLRSQSEPFGLEHAQLPYADDSRQEPLAGTADEPFAGKLSGILSFLDEVSHEVRAAYMQIMLHWVPAATRISDNLGHL